MEKKLLASLCGAQLFLSPSIELPIKVSLETPADLTDESITPELKVKTLSRQLEHVCAENNQLRLL